MAAPTRFVLAGAGCVRFAPDGSLIVAAADGVYRIAPAGGKPRRLLALTPVVPDDPAGPLALTRDGRHALVADGKKVAVIELATTARVIATYSVAGDAVSSIAPSPDGTRVLVVGTDEGGILKCFDLGRPRARYTIGSVRYAHTAWFEDGTRFVTASLEWNVRLQVHDATRGQVVLDLGDPYPKRARASTGVRGIAISRSSDRVFLGCDRGAISVALVAGARARWLLRGVKVRALARATAGDRLAAACDDGTVRIIEPTTRSAVRVIRAGGSVADVCFSPDDRSLAYAIDGAVIRAAAS